MRLIIIALFVCLLTPPLVFAQDNQQEYESIVISESEYDSILSSQSLDFDSDSSVSLGPVTVKWDDGIFEGLVKSLLLFVVGIIPIPSYDFGDNRFARLVIEHIWNINHQDVYIPKEPSKNPSAERFFASIIVIEREDPLAHLHGTEGVELSPNITKEDISSIEGEISLKLPKRIEFITLDAEDVEKEIESTGLIAKLIEVTSNEKLVEEYKKAAEQYGISLESSPDYQLALEGSCRVRLQYDGSLENYIAVLAYNARGESLGEATRSFAESFEDDNKIDAQYFYMGDVKTIKIVVASEVLQRAYPFKLNINSAKN